MHVQTARMTDVQVSWSPCNIFIIIIILHKYSLAHTDTVLVFYFAPIKNATWMCSFTRLRTLLLFFTSTCDAFLFKSPPSPFLVALIQLHSNLKLAAASIRTANLLYLSWVRSVPPSTAQLFCKLHIFQFLSFFFSWLQSWADRRLPVSSALTIILTLNIKDSSKCKALPVVMNIFGVFWIVVSRKPDKRQKEKSLLCHLCCAGSLTPCRVSSLSLSLNIVSDLERDIFSEGSTSEVLRPVYVPTFHLHTVYLGKQRKECLHFSPSSALFIYLFLPEILIWDMIPPSLSPVQASCWWWSWLIFISSRSAQLMLRLTDADVRDSLPHGLIWTEKLWRAVTWNNNLNLKLIRVLSADQSGDYIYIESSGSGGGAVPNLAELRDT